MLKKLLFVGGAAALLMALLFGREGFSYATTALSKFRSNVRNSVPVEFDLERAEKAIRSLDKDIEANVTAIAQEEVEVEKLARQVTQSQKQLAQAEAQIKRLNEDLISGTTTFVYAGETYTSREVRADLERRFATFTRQEAAAKSLEKMLTARQQKLDAVRDKLDSMVAAKQQLELTIQDLATRQKLAEVQETASEFHIDDSRLARTRELVESIETRIQVKEKLINSANEYQFEIPLEDEGEDVDISDKITRHFSKDRVRLEALADN